MARRKSEPIMETFNCDYCGTEVTRVQPAYVRSKIGSRKRYCPGTNHAQKANSQHWNWALKRY